MADGECYVPVYLPNRTVVGKAKINGKSIEIQLKTEEPITTLMQDNLLGVSFVYMSNDARDILDELSCIDENCLYGMPHMHGKACYAGCTFCQRN